MGRMREIPDWSARFSYPGELLVYSSKVLGFALLLALSARLQFIIPGTPVPATLQVMAVLIAGAILGPWGGLACVSSYLAAGIAGAPVFAFGGGPAYLLGPTGGYLLGLLPAVYLSGLLSKQASGLWALFGSFSLACVVMHLSGWAQLAASNGPLEAFRLGTVPFIGLDMLKALIAAALIQGVRSRGSR